MATTEQIFESLDNWRGGRELFISGWVPRASLCVHGWSLWKVIGLWGFIIDLLWWGDLAERGIHWGRAQPGRVQLSLSLYPACQPVDHGLNICTLWARTASVRYLVPGTKKVTKIGVSVSEDGNWVCVTKSYYSVPGSILMHTSSRSGSWAVGLLVWRGRLYT